MQTLISTIKNTISEISEEKKLPFSVYSSVHAQKLLNVPIAKPLLIMVLKGHKELGKNNEITCLSEHFIFLSDSPAINMRNIPKDNAYFALLIEFDYEDFMGIPHGKNPTNSNSITDYFIGKITPTLKNCLQQLVESACWAPETLWPLRKKELLMLLHHLGHENIISMMGKPKVSHQVHELCQENEFDKLTNEYICQQLAMSESTLRRKLKLEGTSIQAIKDRAKLGLGLHLLQTTKTAIGIIADKCGYHSQSRFTDRFKSHFGLTPSELRRTKVTD
ncbi:MAG: AraC-like DNA-binding protein [Paraglaciecola sp.]|jgi:AraC-like DNA-binding protein